MRFYHTVCGGEIDVKKRRCKRCPKKWDPISFKLDPTGIRPMVDKKGRPLPGGEDIKKLKKQYVSWGDKIPGLAIFVSKLPRWPRWARILATIVFLAVVAAIIFLIVWLRR